MCILRTRMDVNYLFALLLVNAVLELSTPFSFDQISLDCLGHMCYHKQHSGSRTQRQTTISSHVHNNDHHHGNHRRDQHTHRLNCDIDTSDGELHGSCEQNDDHINVCPNLSDSKCRCYNQSCIDGFLQQYSMTYPCLNKFCHGTEHCHLRREEHKIVSSCSANHVTHGHEYCVDHASVISHGGCYCDTADCVQKTALHCLNVTCNPSQGCEIYRDNGQFAARCDALDHCGDHCRRCHEPLMLDHHQRLPCYCISQTCADRIEIPTVTTPVPTTSVPVLQQLVPYTCVAANCSKYEPFCQLFEANNNVEGRCMVFQVGQLCSPVNDLSVHGGCYCSDSKCVSNAITDYNQKHTTAATLAPGYMCNKELCRSDAYCQIMNYNGVATSRCIVFKATQSCQTYKDVDGAGCTCDNTNCSINILNEFSLHHLETTTTTSTTTQSITQSTTPTTAATTPTTKTPTTTPSTTTTTKSPTTTTATTTTTPTTTPTTTIPTTTTPTTTTVTTTTAPTTTPTTAVPTATTPTTTTPTATTTATGPRTCHICGDTSLPVPCSSRQIGRDLSHTCNTGENYCMTDIVQDDQGNVDVFKRCVDLATCEKKWITESADLDYCKRYGVVKNPYAFSCHFCCTEDKCNSMLVPNTTTWYTKTN